MSIEIIVSIFYGFLDLARYLITFTDNMILNMKDSMKIKSLVILLVFICVTSFSQTIYGDMSLPPGAFLWLPADASSEALAGSGTAGHIETSTGWANPATIGDVENLIAGATYSYMRYKTNHSSLFSNYHYQKWSGAVKLFLINSTDIEARSGPTEDPQYTFASHQLYSQFTVAREIYDFMKLGVSAKWIHERIDQDDRSGWIFDAGVTGNYKFIDLGFSVQNYGKEVVFRMYRERYPLTYRAGISSQILDYGRLWVDYIKPDRLDGWYAIGAEGKISHNFNLRLGYTPNHDTRNISMGIGAKFNDFQLDYAMANYSEGLGLSHQVTLSYNR